MKKVNYYKERKEIQRQAYPVFSTKKCTNTWKGSNEGSSNLNLDTSKDETDSQVAFDLLA